MNKYTRLYLNYTKCGPFFNDYMGEFLVSIYTFSLFIVSLYICLSILLYLCPCSPSRPSGLLFRESNG